MTKTKNKPTIISFILDRSGSMESMKKAVISGFNEYVNGLKKSKDTKNVLFSLTTFDTDGIDRPYIATPISKVEPLTEKTYIPRSGTPLYDAAVDTIESLAEKVTEGQPALVVIMTDGEENSSHKHDQKCFADLVEKLKMKGNWTFVFLGANQDAWANAQQFGLVRGAVADFEFSETGIDTAFRSLSKGTVAYAANMASIQASGGDSKLMNTNETFFANTKLENKGGAK